MEQRAFQSKGRTWHSPSEACLSKVLLLTARQELKMRQGACRSVGAIDSEMRCCIRFRSHHGDRSLKR